MGDNYLTWTEDVCSSPSPPPPPPSPHAPVCSYYIMESNANTEACPASDRITTEGACESYDQWLRDGNNFASSGLTGTLQEFRKSPSGSSALAGGCNVAKTSSPQVWFDPALSQTLATAGGNYYAVCGGCFPPSPPPPSPSPPPPSSPPPSPPPPVPRAVLQPRQCVTTADGVSRCIQIQEGLSLNDERVQAMIDRHFGSAVPPPSPERPV